MTGLLPDLAAPASRQALERALAAWLPQQRWFAGKAREVAAVRLEDAWTVTDDGAVVDLVVAVAYADGGGERYQVPVAAGPARDNPHAIAGTGLVDALEVPAACRQLADLAVGSASRPTAAGAVVEGRPVSGRRVAAEAPPRRLRGEQSNTSVVFGDDAILKVFRRLEPGLNPDVELTAGLTRAGFPSTPPQRGALALRAHAGETTLAVLSDLVKGARDAWELACDEVRALAEADERGDPPGGVATPVLDGAARLGATVASLHATLRDVFGSRGAQPGEVGSWVAAMHRQVARVLALAEERAPDTAAEVLRRRGQIDARLEGLRAVADPGPLLRTHGDLHLGQVLLAADGAWQLLDFEGEPSRPLAERRSPQPPLRDVAGMLRSFDYATAALGPTAPPAAQRWRDEARHSFLAGYLRRAADAGVLPADHQDVEALLSAFELDKAVYELGYELANRPRWVAIPLAGILRVLEGPTPATDQGAAVPSRSTPQPSAPTWRAHPDAVQALLEGRHTDPHSLLGVHQAGSGAVARTYRPDAEEVAVLVDGEEPVVAERVDGTGLFEVRLDARPDAAAYRWRVRYPDGATYELRDPYAFWPTLGEIDLHLAGEGRHEELWRRMGAHVTEIAGVEGTAFAVWAPNARAVRVVGDFNSWDGRLHPMRRLGSAGIWELFLPEVGDGAYYKYEIVDAQGQLTARADPYAFATEVPPGTASRIHRSRYTWNDHEWLAQRSGAPDRPLSIYEVHLGSWRRGDSQGDGAGEPMGYRDLAHALGDHVERLGFTHVELLPVAEHPFGGSWGYQVTGYFAPTARFGDPDDFRYFVDHLHSRGIGVIVDWVPAHFPRDEWALARFDGTALYEHADPRQGSHPDWGTLVFNFGRNEVRNFLIANALFWLEELHVDGLRVDAVASMLYLDYSRKEGEWVPNAFGGRENLEAVDFLKELNAVVYGRNPGAMMIAEESTAWPAVSRPTYLGGLGFGFKWNMGWMHDTLEYFSKEPVYRRFHHNQLTFSLVYAFSENFVLPLSHDEVVHGKRSLIDKMPGDRWQKFANLRALYGYMWAHPGKQLLFMGGEFGQWREWSEERELDWHLLDESDHGGLAILVGDLNRRYLELPALWQRDSDPGGFQWIDANDADDNVLSFVRWGAEGEPPLVCLANFAPVPRRLRTGLPVPGDYEEVLNTDAATYGGGNVGNLGSVHAEPVSWHGMAASADVTLPPLATIWLRPAS